MLQGPLQSSSAWCESPQSHSRRVQRPEAQDSGRWGWLLLLALRRVSPQGLPSKTICGLISSSLDQDSPGPHFNLITSLKTLSPNTVSFRGPGGQGINTGDTVEYITNPPDPEPHFQLWVRAERAHLSLRARLLLSPAVSWGRTWAAGCMPPARLSPAPTLPTPASSRPRRLGRGARPARPEYRAVACDR